MRIAIDFGGRLAAKKTTRARPNGDFQFRLVATNKAAAEAAREGPNALAPREGMRIFIGFEADAEITVLSPKIISTSSVAWPACTASLSVALATFKQSDVF